MPDRAPSRRLSLGRLLLAPVAFAAVFGPVAWSRESHPILWSNVPEGQGTFWATVAAVALAEATRRARSGRELAAIGVGYGAGVSFGWSLISPFKELVGPVIGPVVGLLVFWLVRPPGGERSRPDVAEDVRVIEGRLTG